MPKQAALRGAGGFRVARGMLLLPNLQGRSYRSPKVLGRAGYMGIGGSNIGQPEGRPVIGSMGPAGAPTMSLGCLARPGTRPRQRLRGTIGTVLALLQSSCGLTAPDLQSPFTPPADLHMTVDHIINEVKCELTHGIIRAIARDDLLAAQNGTPPRLAWLDGWSALATLTLSAEEITALNPAIGYTDVLANSVTKFANGAVTNGQSFSLGGGLSASADGTRTGKVNFFFVFSDFLAKEPRQPYTYLTVPCEHQSSILLESHLKLDDWIEQALYPALTNANLVPEGYNQPTSLISHEVNFVINTFASLNPVWKLIPVSVNGGALPFFQASRNQTNDLLITLGQTAAADAGKKAPAAPSTEVLDLHLASEIGTAVATSIRGP